MTIHQSVLLEPLVDAVLAPLREKPATPPGWLVDCTLGGGGHTAKLLEKLSTDPSLSQHRVLSLDQDANAVESARQRFQVQIQEGKLILVHARFSELPAVLDRWIGSDPVHGLIADLGYSSDQLEDESRGLSFLREGPLDMRLNPEQGESCYEFLSRTAETQLADVLFRYGEERYSRRIARSIIQSRQRGELPRTTTRLAELIARAVPPSARHGRIHAATRSFQALRIVINQELEELDALLGRGILCVRKEGRVAILSFHSLEDRRVKLAFRNRELGFRPLTKKPVQPTDDEIRSNPRSRSAKLRIAERVEP